MLLKWIQQNPTIEKIAYFFENGVKEQPETNTWINTLFSLKDSKSNYRYATHNFIKKTDSAVLQATDLLAWQLYEEKRDGKKQRKDIASLLKHPHYTDHLTKDKLTKIQEKFEKIPGYKDYYIKSKSP